MRSASTDISGDVVRNLVSNPRGRDTSGTVTIAENLITNPRGRNTSGTVTIAENLVTNPRGRNTGGTPVTIRENLCPNPRGSAGWARTGSATTGQGGSIEYDSEGILVTYGTEPAYGTIYCPQDRDISIPDGASKYCVSAFIRNITGSRGVRPSLLCYDEAGAQVGNVVTQNATPSHQGERHEWVVDLPEGTRSVRVYFYGISNDVPGDQQHFSRIYYGTTPGPYFDGDTWDGDPDFTPVWTGTPGASTSRLVAPRAVGVNATRGIAYFSQRNDAIALIVREGEPTAYTTGPTPDSREGQVSVVTEVWTESGGPIEVRSYFVSNNAATTAIDGHGVLRATAANTDGAFIGLYIHEPGRTAYFRASVIPGDYSGSYFDGHESYDPDFTPEWLGAPDSSTSRLTAASPVGQKTTGTQIRHIYQHTENNETFFRHVLHTDGPIGVLNYDNSILNLQQGESYTLLMRARANRTITATPRIASRGGQSYTLPANEWVDLCVHTDISGTPNNFTGLILGNSSGHQAGDTIDVGRVLLARGEYNGPYFDGDTSPDPDLTPEWTGTPGASTSRLVAPAPVGWMSGSSDNYFVYYSESRDAIAIHVESAGSIILLSWNPPSGLTGPHTMLTDLIEAPTRHWALGWIAADPSIGDYHYDTGTGATLRQFYNETGTGYLRVLRTTLPQVPVGETIYLRSALVPGHYTGPYIDGHTPGMQWAGLSDSSISLGRPAPKLPADTNIAPHISLWDLSNGAILQEDGESVLFTTHDSSIHSPWVRVDLPSRIAWSEEWSTSSDTRRLLTMRYGDENKNLIGSNGNGRAVEPSEGGWFTASHFLSGSSGNSSLSQAVWHRWQITPQTPNPEDFVPGMVVRNPRLLVERSS